MNMIRKKLLDFKMRLRDGKMYSISLVILFLTLGWGIYQYNRANNYRHELDSTYNRAFFDLVSYVQNVETLLTKSFVSATPTRTALTLKEAWRQANLAQENLSLLPVSQPVLGNTSKFLTQVGDLSYALSNQSLNGTPLSSSQYKTIESLNNYAYNLKNSLYDLQNQVSAGRMKWGELSEKGTPSFSNTSANLPLQNFETIEKTFKDFPTLIYDGPFSDHLISAIPKGLTGENIDKNVALNVAKEFPGIDNVLDIIDSGKDEVSTIKTFNYNITLKTRQEDSTYGVAVSQQGGHVIWMLHQRAIGNKTLNMDAANQKAQKFLESKGLYNMSQTYYIMEDGTATINFAYKKENIIIYSDLIKVKVALDNGEIVGFESKGYYTAHHNRNLAQPNISLEEARKKINPLMKINSFGLAIIPTEYKTEILCYEFKGRINNRDFLVYINAQNGQEENILLIMETSTGVLTL